MERNSISPHGNISTLEANMPFHSVKVGNVPHLLNNIILSQTKSGKFLKSTKSKKRAKILTLMKPGHQKTHSTRTVNKL